MRNWVAGHREHRGFRVGECAEDGIKGQALAIGPIPNLDPARPDASQGGWFDCLPTTEAGTAAASRTPIPDDDPPWGGTKDKGERFSTQGADDT